MESSDDPSSGSSHKPFSYRTMSIAQFEIDESFAVTVSQKNPRAASGASVSAGELLEIPQPSVVSRMPPQSEELATKVWRTLQKSKKAIADIATADAASRQQHRLNITIRRRPEHKENDPTRNRIEQAEDLETESNAHQSKKRKNVASKTNFPAPIGIIDLRADYDDNTYFATNDDSIKADTMEYAREIRPCDGGT